MKGRFSSIRFALPLVGVLFAFSAWSQNRYSHNVVGYVDARFLAGSNLFNNPLVAEDNSVAALLKGVPSGSYYQAWAGQGFAPPNRYSSETGWDDAGKIITRLNGGFLWLPEAKTVSFVGQPSPPFYLTLPPGFSISPVIPDAPSLYVQAHRWNRETQQFEYIDYVPFDGLWFPEKPTLLPDESVLLFVSGPAPAPIRISGVVAPPSVTLSNPKRSDSDFTFEFTAPNGSTYSVQQADDLTSGSWRTIQTATAGAGVTPITVPFQSSGSAFFRIESLILRHPSRTGTGFQFQFYAENGVRYVISRSPSLENQVWQTVTFIEGTGAVTTVTDSNATGSVGYYRVAY